MRGRRTQTTLLALTGAKEIGTEKGIHIILVPEPGIKRKSPPPLLLRNGIVNGIGKDIIDIGLEGIAPLTKVVIED